MLNQTIFLKVKERLNKLDSQDFDNIQCWQLTEAYNKAQLDWCRRQLVGTNIRQEADEQSERRIDDLNILLKTMKLTWTTQKLYEESQNLPSPEDYLAYKRPEIYATSECCSDPRLMIIYLVEEANVINYLTDDNKKPSFEWGETFATLVGRKLRIYTNGEFKVSSGLLMYYKQPRRIQVKGCSDPYTGQLSTTEVIPDFKDDVVEVIIDDAAALLAGDIESMFQVQREKASAEANN